MRTVAAGLLVLLLVLPQLTIPVRADSAADEIAYLLQTIRQSPCTFIRNGSDYDGAAAAEHIQAKYDHLKREIHTVEDFIDRAATKSMVSGEPYQVRCPNEPTIAAAGWLRNLLHSYRAQRAPTDTP